MRLAYLINQYPRSTHTFIRREIKALEAEGHEVLRFSLRPTLAPSDRADREELVRTRSILAEGVLRMGAAVVWTLLIRPLRMLLALKLAVRMGRRSDRGVLIHLVYLAEACVLLRLTRDVEWLHAHFGTNSATVAMLLRGLGGPGFSFTVHGTTDLERPEILALRAKISCAGFMVAVSDFGRAQLFRWVDPADWAKIHVVRCGVGKEFLDAQPAPPPPERRLVCVARMSGEKGHLVLLEAAARLAERGQQFQLTLVGDGTMRSDVEAFIRGRNLGGHVRLTGWLRPDEVREEILRSRCLVQPSFAEGLPVTILEALALGRPVIASAVAGIPEVVKDGVNGWLVPASNVDELAQRMAEVLAAAPQDLARMGRDGAKRVAERHDAHREARKLATLFEKHACAASPASVVDQPPTVKSPATVR